MKWVFLVVGSLIVLVALVVGIGAMVSKEHVASRTARFKQARETVWQTITDFERHTSWRPGLSAMERLPDREGHAVWREVRKPTPLTYEVVEFQAPARMITRIADPDLPFGGTWTYEIEPLEGGCRVTLTENGEIYNPVFRFMARFVFGYHATMDAYLKALGKKFGEDVTPEPA